MKYSIIVVVSIVLIVSGIYLVFISPGQIPANWNVISHKLAKTDLYKLIGPPTEIETEALWEIWEEKQHNGSWILKIRFDLDGKVGVGDYTFCNDFYDADWNPLPKPYSLANYTTTLIP